MRDSAVQVGEFDSHRKGRHIRLIRLVMPQEMAGIPEDMKKDCFAYISSGNPNTCHLGESRGIAGPRLLLPQSIR